jgi:flavodoxin
MANGKALIVCASCHHGNTARVARCMADVLGATVNAPPDVPATRIGDYDLIGIGSGIYYGGLHPDIRTWVRSLPDASTPTTRCFLFSTSGLPFLTRLWHGPLKAELARKGLDVVGEFHCRGFDTWGPLALFGGINRGHPDDRDLERAARFAGTLRRAEPAGGVPTQPLGEPR